MFKKYRNLHYRLLNLWPLGLWVGAVVVALALSGSRSWRSEFVGVYDCDRSLVASVERGRVERIDVSVGEQVGAGQRIAQLQTEILAAELREWQSEKAERLSDRELDKSLLTQELDRDLQQARLELESDQAELEVLRVELSRLEGLMSRNLVDRDRYAELDARTQRLKAAVRSGEGIVDTLESELRQSPNTTLREFSPEGELSLVAQMSELSLRTRRDGIVGNVLKREGEVVLPGETIAEVLHQETAKVVGFLPVESAGRIQVGQEVEVFTTRFARGATRGVVRNLSPSTGFSMESGQAQLGAGRSGLRFSVDLDSKEGFIIGEPVRIKVMNKTWLESFASVVQKFSQSNAK